MVILVTGGRHFRDYQQVNEALSIHVERTRDIVIQGGATGVDSIVKNWCKRNGVHCAEVQALWDTLGKSAGPRRNRMMLELNPGKLLAFAGGKGTADMVKAARVRGVTVYEIPPRESGEGSR